MYKLNKKTISIERAKQMYDLLLIRIDLVIELLEFNAL